MIQRTKLLQTGQMDLVYAHAVLTIVAACSEDADTTLVGLNPDSAYRAQPGNLGGRELTAPFGPPAYHSACIGLVDVEYKGLDIPGISASS